VPLSLPIAIYVALLGLIIGSYLNVLIHRLPLGISTVTPRSRCPGCGEVVAARDNIPILSYLLLRGRCRHCKTEISARYPMIEALTALLFVACYWQFDVSVELLAGLFFCAAMVALAAIDAEHFLLPDKITLPGIALGLLLSRWLYWSGWRSALLGALLGGGLLWALAEGWYRLRGEEGMGLGDVKMLAMLGAFLGWKGMLVALFFASVSGSAVGLAMIAGGRGGMKSKLPFGSFLALGGVVSLFVGPAIVRYYSSLL